MRGLSGGWFAVTGLGLSALLGCQAAPAGGNGGGPGPGSGGTAATTGGSGNGGSGTIISMPGDCTNTSPKPGRSPLRRLNRAEYKSTVHDLLGVDTATVDTFPPDNAGLGFTNNADVLSVTNLLAEAYMTGSEGFAKAALANIATLVPCASVGDDACAKQFIADFGLRALRHPLTDADNTTYFNLFTAGKMGGTFADGIELVIEGMLQSSDFLYRVEQSDPAAPADAVVAVNDFEMATRLSYFFWGTMPDKTLFDAAAAKRLTAPADIEAQVTRMLTDPKAKAAVAQFHGEWLSTGQVSSVEKDGTMFPEFTPAIRAAMRQEVETFVDQVFWTDGKVETLFSAPYSYMSKDLAAFYGVAAPAGDGFQKVMLDPTQRAGIATQGALLTSFAKPNQSSPVLRGKFVREQFFCTKLPDPPANLVIVAPTVAPGSTTRQRFAQHEKDPMCASCHTLMDGLGLGFEQYDPIGRWRTQDQGLPVDSSGTVVGTDVDGTFIGGAALSSKLAQSGEVRACVVKQWFRYANGRQEIDADSCTLQNLNTQFDSGGHDMRDLRVKIALSDAFRFRSLHGGGQ
jgi:Protein of unknown function (DUF1592)/Protein of unknown function (DUF1588)/Protein of unknown function (DUF1587)/Protein of unknown function (DUF1595)/Protein of unknown function (DUF1585)